MLERLDIAAMPFEGMIAREWLCTNGLGGYACSTVPGLNSRKYHGLLVAAMAPPVRRMVLLSRVEEVVHHDGWPLPLGCNEYPGTIHPEGHRMLRAFSAEPFPRWAYQGEGWTLQKELCLLRGRNTVCLTYTLLGGNKPVTLELSPLFALRPIHELSYQWNGRLVAEPWGGAEGQGQGTQPAPKSTCCHRIPATSRTPEVFFAHDGGYEARPNWYFNTIYRREQQRGYAGLEDLWTPGVVRQTLQPGQSLHFVCSTDPVVDLPRIIADCDEQNARDAEEVGVNPHARAMVGAAGAAAAQDEGYQALRRAAEQFVASVPRDEKSADGAGERTTAVVTQYPWSPPSGRWAMVSLPGLFLVTGKFDQARSLLLSMAAKLERGLMPSEFPEDGSAPVYHGADVSLWFANAVYQYLRYSGDEATVRRHLFDALLKIIDAYRAGTDLGVRTDADGLLCTHAAGIGTTWMDANLAGWVLTPRQSRPVEVNALWYNALCVTADLAQRFGRFDLADPISALSRSVKAAFNVKFWNEPAGCCFDVVHDVGRDPAVRPNQLLALSLPFPVLSPDRHASVLNKVKAELLTPRGLRTLAPGDPGYQGKYQGHVVQRDKAYHGGSAFPWLLGPYVTATLRLHGRGEAARSAARQLLQPCLDYLRGDGLGQLCELFDGDAPHAPGGAIASAPAVAELLRCYEEDILDRAPGTGLVGGTVAIDPSSVIRTLPMSPQG